jgi:hypothetical protein
MPFKKGQSGNPAGRPKGFVDLRNLARTIGHEMVLVTMPDGTSREMTRTEAILREWAGSRLPILQQKYIEIAYGKVPDTIDLTMLQLDLEHASDEDLKRIRNGESPFDVLSGSRSGRA